VTLAVVAASLAILVGFATRLTARIRKLHSEAEEAIDSQGRVRGAITTTGARDEIGDLTRTTAAMLARLKDYNAYLEAMAGRLSHELRTPVAVVRSSLDNLKAQSLTDDARVYVDRAGEGVDRLGRLISRLSEATRLERMLESSERERFDLAHLVEGCVEGYRSAYPGREFDYVYPPPPLEIVGIPDAFAQLLDKLVKTRTTSRPRARRSASSWRCAAFASPSRWRTTARTCPTRTVRASSIRSSRFVPRPAGARRTWGSASTWSASSPRRTAGACARKTSPERAACASKSRCFCRKLCLELPRKDKVGPHRPAPHHRVPRLARVPRFLSRADATQGRHAGTQRERRGHGLVRPLRREPSAQRSAAAGQRLRVPRQPPLHPGSLSSAAENLAIAERRRFSRGPLMVVPDDTTWRTLVVFCLYRVILAVFVGGAFIFLNRFFNLGVVTPGAVVPTVVSYTLASVLLLVPARLREPSLVLQVTAGVVVDVLAIVMLMYASGGVRSGLGVILLVSLAAAGLITRGRLAFFHAAIAALAVLLEQTFQMWRYDAGIHDFVQAGLTSAASSRRRASPRSSPATRAPARRSPRSARSTSRTSRRSTSSSSATCRTESSWWTARGASARATRAPSS
jgi:HAMP domain-containing protein